MIGTLLKIRFKQFYRGIAGIGLLRILFLTGLLGFLGITLFVQTFGFPNAYYVVGGYSLMIALIHINRQDKLFLKSHFNNYKFLFLVEYLILSLPLLFCLLYHFQWMSVALYLGTLAFIVNLDIKIPRRNINSRFQQWIPNECFEWKAGIRKHLIFIVPLWCIGMCTSFFIGSVPVVIFILGIIPLSFYETGEPLQMILAFEKNTNRFLCHKIKWQTAMFSILTLPLIALFLIFHYEMWYIPIAEYLIFLSLHINVILTKYAFYEPNSKSASGQLFNAIGVLGGIIPVFIPVVWLMSIRFYFKSRENLNFYLNDYN